MSVGRRSRFSGCCPAAMAPDVTRTTSMPRRRRRAICAAIEPMRPSSGWPSSASKDVVPIFITSRSPALSSALATALPGFELECLVGDADLVAGPSPRLLQDALNSHGDQPALEARYRLLIIEITRH